MITISHTHADGTLVYGTSRDDGTAAILKGLRFRWFPSIKLWGIPQSRDHLAKRWQIGQAAKAMREAGHDVTVEIDDTARDVTEAKADRAERLDARADRLSTKAERQAAEAERRFAAADHYAERFAGGQPILVGHYSERSARTAQKRIDQNMRAGTAAAGKADRAAAAAAVVGKADAYRERPDVIIRRIAKTEAELRKVKSDLVGRVTYDGWDPDTGRVSKPRLVKPEGDWLEQCEARRAYLEHQLEADREALKAHEAAGYTCHSRETVHAGDIITRTRHGSYGCGEVARANAKTVSVKNEYSWTDKVSYEDIRAVLCPHNDPAVAAALAKIRDGESAVAVARSAAADGEASAPPKPAVTPRPVPVTVERPAERPEPLHIDARFEFFPTPAAVVNRMIELAELKPGMDVLEPSAGLGAIANAVAPLVGGVYCIELSQQMADRLRADHVAIGVRCADFLEVAPEPVYDRVLMNPPFANQADIRHVTHALGFLKPGGLLVAVMSAGAEFRTDKTAEQFRKLVADRGGRIDALPPDAFKQSGTSVRTVLAVIPAGVPDEGEAGCSCCQARSLAGQAHHECARCGHPGKFHVTCNMPPAQLTAMLSGTLF